MNNSNRLLITQSLLAAYNYSFTSDKGYEDFLVTLRREPIKPTMPMLNGQKFENLVTAYAGSGEYDKDHEWAEGIKAVGDAVRGCQFQVKLSKEIEIDGIPFLLYGILDGLKAGEIYDIKFSQTYHINKYLLSPQHPMYFELCPEARAFTYVISDGLYTWRERYLREDTGGIIPMIKGFMTWLEQVGLAELYIEKWRAK